MTKTMTKTGAWSQDELQRIAETDDLHMASFREDGSTYGTPTWIWSVVVGDQLYVRAYNGTNSRWYQAALKQKAGRITAAGMTKEVAFEPVRDAATNDQIKRLHNKPRTYSLHARPVARTVVCALPWADPARRLASLPRWCDPRP